jgi:hypothetical protein
MQTVSIQAAPNKEQSIINIMEKFFWETLSTQTVDVKDSHLEREGSTLYSVTERERYIKLAFHRDNDKPKVKNLIKLEDEYMQAPGIEDRPEDIDTNKVGIRIFYKFLLGGFIILVLTSVIGFGFFGFFVLLILAAIGYFKWKTFKKSPEGINTIKALTAQRKKEQEAYDNDLKKRGIRTKLMVLSDISSLIGNDISSSEMHVYMRYRNG